MELKTVYGYKELFGTPRHSYEELLIDIPSDVINVLMIALNNELNAHEDGSEENQQRIFKIISDDFLQPQKDYLEEAFQQYKLENGSFESLLFGRRYLLGMLIKEFKRNKVVPGFVDTTPNQMFRILLAFLMVVDELNDADEVLIKTLSESQEELGRYKMLWLSFIDQYEFNDDNNAFFQVIKLLCFSKYCFVNLRPYLKEYLAKCNFESLSPFLASCTQLVKSTLTFQADKLFKKLNFIVPSPAVDTQHLEQQRA